MGRKIYQYNKESDLPAYKRKTIIGQIEGSWGLEKTIKANPDVLPEVIKIMAKSCKIDHHYCGHCHA